MSAPRIAPGPGRPPRLGAVAALALALAWAAPVAQAAPADAARAAELLRAHTLRRLDGGTTAIADLRGEVVVVNLWASWCAPCRRELPALDALHARLRGRGGQVVAVSIDLEAANVRRFASRLGLRMPVYHDGPDGLARALDVPSVPYTLVLDRDGRVALASSGSDAAALARIEQVAGRLLAGPGVATDASEGGSR